MMLSRLVTRVCLLAASCAVAPVFAQTTDCLSPTVTANSIDMRVLVIAADGTEVVLPGMISALRHLGVPFDVMYAKNQVLDASVLCNPSGMGQARYQGILLTTGSLGFQNASGGYESALTWEEWNLLWGYEAKYRVRQATFYTYPGSWPDNFGLSAPSAGVDTSVNPITAQLTTTSPPGSQNPSGVQVFSDLKPTEADSRRSGRRRRHRRYLGDLSGSLHEIEHFVRQDFLLDLRQSIVFLGPFHELVRRRVILLRQ